MLGTVGSIIGPVVWTFLYVLYSLILAALAAVFLMRIGVPQPSGGLPRALSFYAAVLVYALTILLCSVYGVVASAVLRLAGFGGLSQWATARCFRYVSGVITGIWFEILPEDDAGEERVSQWLHEIRPAVFVGNHQTELDVLMIGVVFPKYCSVSAKKSLKMIPFLGQFMTLSNTIFIDRANRGSAISAFDSAGEKMKKERQSVFIFPEGTRSYSSKSEMLEFKKGALWLALGADVPIVPVVSANYSAVWSYKTQTFRPGCIPIQIMRPIYPTEYSKDTIKEMTQSLHDRMSGELRKLDTVMNKWNPPLELVSFSKNKSPRTVAAQDSLRDTTETLIDTMENDIHKQVKLGQAQPSEKDHQPNVVRATGVQPL